MNKRIAALLGSLAFFWIAPATVAGYIPWMLTKWQMQPPLLRASGSRWLGGALLGAGAIIVVDSFARCALKGLGTPMPLAPPERLVISGLYRYVRNPMYLGVVHAIVGQALLFGSLVLLPYAALVWLIFFAFVVLYEEPILRQKFGPSYEHYQANVRRWWPRITPWRGLDTT